MKILLFANTDWYLYNFRLPLARALKDRGHAVTLMSPDGEYRPRLQAEGFRWLEFRLERKGTNPLAEVGTLWRLAAVYRRERPDLAHHFTIKPVLYGSLAARWLGIRPVINAVTGMGFVFTNTAPGADLLRGLVKALYRLALKGSTVVFQNPDDRASFQRSGLVDMDQCVLIRGSGVDVEQFTPLPEPEGEPPVVVLPSRLLWDKGIAEFVEAARQLKREGVQARFVLVGGSDADNPGAVPPSQVALWEQEGVVEAWGWQADMLSVYRRAHLVCYPSYREGLPRALLEAGACGRALVTTDAPGCREVVTHGVNGLLAPVKDSAALADALRTLITQPALRAEMGRNGRQIIEREFSTRKVVSETLAVYDKLLLPRSAG